MVSGSLNQADACGNGDTAKGAIISAADAGTFSARTGSNRADTDGDSIA